MLSICSLFLFLLPKKCAGTFTYTKPRFPPPPPVRLKDDSRTFFFLRDTFPFVGCFQQDHYSSLRIPAPVFFFKSQRTAREHGIVGLGVGESFNGHHLWFPCIRQTSEGLSAERYLRSRSTQPDKPGLWLQRDFHHTSVELGV